MTNTCLYRLYAPDGTLLYVGISMSPLARVAQHRSDKVWWTEVGRIEVANFDTKAAALHAEAQAIESEQPVYNLARPAAGELSANYASSEIEDQLAAAGEQARLWTLRRDELIRTTSGHVSLRRVAEIVGLSHTAVAKIQKR